ncbi:Ig-like domain repeat protein [Streptomyces sp. NPDC006339]|uniref:Ig-like domain repeat protein n=1 Tax=Streptomyces sp. NPDC006339 TaxID=3156755 RepID=UPI0033A177B8
MRKRTLSAATSLAVLFSSAALVAGTAGPAAADSSVALPVSSVGDMVVDGVHQKIFISDPTNGKLVVTDYAGTVLTTLADLPGVRGLEISADSSRVYAAVAGKGEILSISTETPTDAIGYDLGEAENPADLAIAGGKIWFGYGKAGAGNLGSLDLSGETPQVALAQAADGTFFTAPLLGADPAAPGVLAAGTGGGGTAGVWVFDVSAGSATVKASLPNAGTNLGELDVTPDGTQVITSSGYPYYHQAYSTTDLSEVTRYHSASYPNAVAIASDGTIAAGTASSSEKDVRVFRPGNSTSVHEFETGGNVAAGALAWAPDNSKLFAVSQSSYGGPARLNILDDPTKAGATVTVNAPYSAVLLKPLTVTGTVTSPVALPAGTAVEVTRVDAANPEGTSLGGQTLGANGAFSFTDTPTVAGSITYKVTYAGDAEHAAATGTAVVRAAQATSSVVVNAPTTAPVLKPLTVTGTATSTEALPAGTPVAVTRFDVENPQGKALGTKTLAANGAFSFADTPTAAGNVTYKVTYAGDTQRAAASGSALVKVSHNKTAISIDRNGTLVNYGSTVTYTATLGPTYKNRTVEIWADPWGPEPKRLLKRGTVNSAGKLSASMWMNRDTTVTAVFAGDARYAWAQAKSGVYTKAGVSTSLSRHYKWTKIGTTWYQTYRTSNYALITTWHNAYPNRSTRLDAQMWYAGAWRDLGPEYFLLDRYGKSYVRFDGDPVLAGHKFRIRSAYIDGTSGDNVNATAYGPWKYFNFTR